MDKTGPPPRRSIETSDALLWVMLHDRSRRNGGSTGVVAIVALCLVMALVTLVALRSFVSDGGAISALAAAFAGIFDGSSWAVH